MATKDKAPHELLNIAAQQGKHAAKNVARAAEEVVTDAVADVAEVAPVSLPIPDDQYGIAFQLRISNKVLGVGAGAVAVVGGVYGYKQVHKALARRKAEKESPKSPKVVDVTENTDKDPRVRPAV